MNTIPQITSAEPRIRMPAWRSASPKNLKTRPLRMSPKTSPVNAMIDPRLAAQSVGTASQPPAGLGGVPAERPGARVGSLMPSGTVCRACAPGNG